MMSPSEFEEWANHLNLTEEAVREIQRIRTSPPARRVGGGTKNVSGKYSSNKMGVTIQFESHKVELPAIYMMEYNDNVLEYYDQPPSIKIYYYHSKKNNRKMAYRKTADFFVIEKDRAYWVEWKTEEELIRKSQENPDRYFKKNGRWEFAPGKNYAKEFNLDFLVRSSEEINWKLQRNLEFLEDYIVKEYKPEDSNALKIKEAILSNPGLSLLDLIQHANNQYSADDIYALIAQNKIYIDLYNDIITEPNHVKVYLNKEQYKGFSIIEKSSRKRKYSNKIELKTGNRIFWGDSTWTILNYDRSNKRIFLYSNSVSKNVELPIDLFESYISEGYIRAVESDHSDEDNALKKMIAQATEQELEEANKKFEIVTKYLNGEKVELNVTERTLRNWVKKYRDAEELYGNGFVGLLSKTKNRGNRNSKLPPETKKLMIKMIRENFSTIKSKTAIQVYRELLVKCDELNLDPPSYQTFCTEIHNQSKYELELARKGRRASYKYEEFYTELEFTTPKHGERVFEIAHIDHTELDIELRLNRNNTMRPWLTVMIDAFSRRVLAFYLTFEEPSYRSCMMVIRECVKNYNRLPTYVVVDGGKEFHSVYFESLLACFGVHKKQRPAAKARYGNDVERLFGIANELFIHNLAGNTKITKNVRQVTKSVNPKNHAVWTLETLNKALENWFKEVYDNKINPSLHKSPKEAFEESVKVSGSRPNTYIPYDDTFILMTLPSPKGKTRKVHPGKGIKLSYSYYWCDEFRDPKIEDTHVEVKYDPFNIGVAYAYVNNQWVKCQSESYKYLNGKSEKEIKIITEEIRQQNKLYSQNNTVTAKMIAQYIIEAEEKEEILINENLTSTKPELRLIDSNQTNKKSECADDANSNVTNDIYDEDELEVFGELI